MFGRFKSVFMNVVGPNELDGQNSTSENNVITEYTSSLDIRVKDHPYSRPNFLGLTTEETQVNVCE